jgi:hypothetical protein
MRILFGEPTHFHTQKDFRGDHTPKPGSVKKYIPGVGDLSQWRSACLASARPRVRSPAPKKRKRKKKSTFLSMFNLVKVQEGKMADAFWVMISSR